jgi:site-specific DNA recombinase
VLAQKQSDHHSRRLRTLQDEQQKLVQLYYRGGVSEEVLQAEQQRIEHERTTARSWIEDASHEAEDVQEALEDALTIAGQCHDVYVVAEPTLRRMMNQAIFDRLLVRTDEDIEHDLAPAFEHLARLTDAPRLDETGLEAGTAKAPVLSGALGSNIDKMVRAEGLEPTRAFAHRLLRPACLPIPPRPRALGPKIVW